MPSIQRIRSVAGPPSPVFLEPRKYLSPDRQWKVIYHTPREWHMGANGWRVKLFHKWRNVTVFHRGVLRLASDKGFRCEDDFQPWSHDSRALAFLTWDGAPIYIYEVAAKALRPVSFGAEFVRSIQWSPGADRLLVTSTTGALLVDQAALPRGNATWRIAPYESPSSHWTKDGQWFWILARESADTKSVLTFYGGENGTFCEAHTLDPLDHVPYDAEKFASLPRLRYSLVITSSIGAVGQLLDTWHGVHFDQPSGTLYLAVYRPVSTIYKKDEEWRCDVEERWIAVELG